MCKPAYKFKWCGVRYLLTFAFALSIEVWAAGPIVDLTPTIKCSKALSSDKITGLLREILPRLTQGKPIQVRAGSLVDVNESLVLSGTEFRLVVTAFNLVSAMLDAAKSEDSVLGNTARRLKKDQDNVANLVVCVLSKSCRLKRGEALHMSGDLSKIDIVSADGGKRYKIGWASSQFAGPGTPHILILNGGPRTDYVSLTLNILNVATKFADFELIREWIEANIKLLEQGRGPDELFASYVRRRGSDRFEIDEGFMRVFLDSRAAVAESTGFGAFLDRNIVRELQVGRREMAMKDIARYEHVARPIVNKFNLNKDNIIETAERFGHVMTDTIFQAGRLPVKEGAEIQ